VTPAPRECGPPLAGLRVVELARILAGPWIGQTLADLGADVVIENFRVGGLRRFGLDHASERARSPGRERPHPDGPAARDLPMQDGRGDIGVGADVPCTST